MDSINDILKQKRLNAEQKQKPVLPWQDLAAQVYKELGGVDTEKSSVFKYCRDEYARAYAAYKECKERGTNILYWFKIMSGKRGSGRYKH